jgi:uncharacterized glyoxalase superfamily protein PhnB
MAAVIHKTNVNPCIVVVSIEKAIRFYQEAFGFELIESVPGEEGILIHAEMLYQGELILIGKSGAFDVGMRSPRETGVRCPITLCLSTPQVDAFYAHACQQGAISKDPPTDQPWGARACMLEDLDGYEWCVLTHFSA